MGFLIINAAELVMLDKPDEMLELHGLGTLAALELVLPEDHAVLGGLALKKGATIQKLKLLI